MLPKLILIVIHKIKFFTQQYKIKIKIMRASFDRKKISLEDFYKIIVLF